MGRVERIESEIEALSREELGRFRAWFLAFDLEAWDRQFYHDALTGKLVALGDKSLRDHASGKTIPL